MSASPVTSPTPLNPAIFESVIVGAKIDVNRLNQIISSLPVKPKLVSADEYVAYIVFNDAIVRVMTWPWTEVSVYPAKVIEVDEELIAVIVERVVEYGDDPDNITSDLETMIMVFTRDGRLLGSTSAEGRITVAACERLKEMLRGKRCMCLIDIVLKEVAILIDQANKYYRIAAGDGQRILVSVPGTMDENAEVARELEKLGFRVEEREYVIDGDSYFDWRAKEYVSTGSIYLGTFTEGRREGLSFAEAEELIWRTVQALLERLYEGKSFSVRTPNIVVQYDYLRDTLTIEDKLGAHTIEITF